jgi:hypothetical protein
MSSRKKGSLGQIQMTETIAVLFIFIILVAFGLVFYFKYQQGDIAEKEEQLFDQKVIDASLRFFSLPEVSCTEGGSEAESFCLDYFKLKGAPAIFTDDYYYQLFSYSKISLVTLYPEQSELVLYERSLEDSDKIPLRQMVVIKKDGTVKGQPAYHLGYVLIEVYR